MIAHMPARDLKSPLNCSKRSAMGEWQSLHGELQDGVFVVDESKDAYRVTLNSQNQVSWSDSTWELAMITGLPEKVLTVNSANGTYTETYCSYRFVEVVTVDGQEQILAGWRRV